MADVYKLAGKGGMISSGAAGFLKGIASRQREDRESQASREKNALAAFIELRKEGWTVGDPSKGIPGGEGIHLEGFGILVPPEVEGVGELDLAKAAKFRAEADKLGAEAGWFERRPGEAAKGLITWVDPKDRTKQVHLSPGTSPPSGYVKHEVGKAPQALITWINRKDPSKPVKRLSPGEDPGVGYVKYAAFARLQEQMAEAGLEQSKLLRAKIPLYLRQINTTQKFIDMLEQEKKPGDEDSAILTNMKKTKTALERQLEKAQKSFDKLTGEEPLPPSPLTKREGTDTEWDDILQQALTELDFDKEDLTDDELNKLRERMAIIAEGKGLAF